jgi:hypothetical protein
MAHTREGTGFAARSHIEDARSDGGAPIHAEALAYLGGSIVLTGTGLLMAQVWPELGTWARLSLLGVAVVALLAAGLLVRRSYGPAGRARSALWFVSTAVTAVWLSVFGAEALDLAGPDVAVLASVGSLGLASMLWSARPTPLQQVAMMVAAMATAGSAIASLVTPDDLPGVGVWAVAACWGLLGWADLLRPPRLALVLGALSMVVGSLITASGDAGAAFATFTVALIFGVALLTRDLYLVAVAALGALQVLPLAVSRWFPGELAGPLVVLGAGLAVVVIAVVLLRRGTQRTRSSPRMPRISAPAALTACSTVLVVCLAFVSAVALVA